MWVGFPCILRGFIGLGAGGWTVAEAGFCCSAKTFLKCMANP